MLRKNLEMFSVYFRATSDSSYLSIVDLPQLHKAGFGFRICFSVHTHGPKLET